jgi:hypothetical protein
MLLVVFEFGMGDRLGNGTIGGPCFFLVDDRAAELETLTAAVSQRLSAMLNRKTCMWTRALGAVSVPVGGGGVFGIGGGKCGARVLVPYTLAPCAHHHGDKDGTLEVTKELAGSLLYLDTRMGRAACV